MVYDGDGNRVSETVGNVTTNYLVDTQNPTGYAQAVDELQNGAVAAPTRMAWNTSAKTRRSAAPGRPASTPTTATAASAH